MEWWAAGGTFMWVVLAGTLLSGALVGASFLSAVGAWFHRPLRTVARLLGLFAVFGTTVPLLLGLIGCFMNRSVVDSALVSVEPSQAEQIREIGYGEARHPMDLGSAMTCALLVPAALCALAALTVPAPAPAQE